MKFNSAGDRQSTRAAGRQTGTQDLGESSTEWTEDHHPLRDGEKENVSSLVS